MRKRQLVQLPNASAPPDEENGGQESHAQVLIHVVDLASPLAATEQASYGYAPPPTERKRLRCKLIVGIFFVNFLYVAHPGLRGRVAGLKTPPLSQEHDEPRKAQLYRQSQGDATPVKIESPGQVESNFVPSISLGSSDCTVSFSQPPQKTTWETKPFWFPSYPDSFSDGMVKNIISGVTGLNAGAKSYYASSKKLKKCVGLTETALCMLIHPIVKTTPDKFASTFQEEIIYGIRNPITAFPNHHNTKAIKYHNQVGQVPREDWRRFRDEFIEDMMGNWKDQIRVWKNMESYELGMYIRYEHLMDVWFGPKLLQSLARHLGAAGFPAATEKDIPCIWVQSIGGDALEHYSKVGYEYDDYKPGYTKAQQEFFLREMSSFIEENEDDEGLVTILQDYRSYIRDHLLLDQPSANQTAPA